MAAENLTYAEIASPLGVSPEAARGREVDRDQGLVAVIGTQARQPEAPDEEIQHHPAPRRQPPDNQADIIILKERITFLEAELCAEQQRSGDYWMNFERERNHADRERERADLERERADRERERADYLTELQDHLVVELGALRALLEKASRPITKRPRYWWSFRRAG